MLEYLVVAEEACTRKELQPTLEGAIANNASKPHWAGIVKGIAVTASFSSLPKLFNRGSGEWWVEYARDLILTNDSPLVYAGQKILFSASDTLETLSDRSQRLFNEGAILLVRFHRNETTLPNGRIKPAIGWVCRTVRANTVASSQVIRDIITRAELQRAGYIQAYEVASHIKDIWHADPSLAVEVYGAIFGYVEIDRTSTPMGDSQIMSFSTSRNQAYEGAYYLLANDFPAFLSEHPQEATRALIQVIGHWGDQNDAIDETVPSVAFRWNGRQCQLDARRRYGWKWVRRSDDQGKRLQAWGQYLMTLPSNEQGHTKWDAVAEVLCQENEATVIWAKLLEAARHSPAFYAEYLWTILLNPSVLTGSIMNEAEECIEAFASYLPDTAINQIESVILNISHEHFPEASPETSERRLAYIKPRLLSRVPEQQRGLASREFLNQCDPEILQYCRQRSDPAYSSGSNIDWPYEKDGQAEDPSHKEMLQTSESFSNLSSEDITDENVASILETIQATEQMLAEMQGVDEQVNATVQARIIECLQKITCSKATLQEEVTGEFFRRFETVLEQSASIPSDEHLKSFDLHPSWGMPNVRLSAAEGWICLATKKESLEPLHREILIKIASDPEPAIRFILGSRIWSFFKTWPEFVWKTLEHWVADLYTLPGSVGVLKGPLQGGWFWWLRNEDASRADQLLRDSLLAGRSRKATEFQSACGSWVAGLWFTKGETWAYEQLESFIASFRDNVDELTGAQNVAINLLLPRTPKESPAEEQQRALAFLAKLLNIASQVLEAINKEMETPSLLTVEKIPYQG